MCKYPFLWLLTGWLIVPMGWGDLYQDFRFWKAGDGLGESFVYSLTIGPSGKVWVSHGEISVMSELDGFQVYNLPSPGPFLPVQEGLNGQLWSIYNGGFQWFNNPTWIRMENPDIHPVNASIPFVNFPFLPHQDNQVFYVLKDRLMEFHAVDKKTTVFKSVQDTHLEEFFYIQNAKDGGVWLSGKRGILKIEAQDGVINSDSPIQEYLLDADAEFDNFLHVIEGIDGLLYATAQSKVDQKGVILCYRNNHWEVLYFSEDANTLIGGCPGPDNSFYIGKMSPLSDLLLFRREGNHINLIQKSGVLAGQFNSIAVENSGAIWIGTSQGLSRYAPGLWRTPGAVKHIDQTVHSIREDSQGRIWFACRTALVCFDNQQWKEFPFPAPNRSPLFHTDSICSLPDGRLVICTDAANILVFDPTRESFSSVVHPAGRQLQLTSPRRDGTVWVQTLDLQQYKYYIEIYDGQNFREYINQDLPWNLGSIRYIHETRNGDLWFGGTAQDGIGYYHKGTYRTFGPKDGYKDGGAFCIQEMQDGILWIGGRNYLYEYDGREWREILSGLDSARTITAAKDGSFWLASGTGLHRYYQGAWLTNTDAEGLPNTAVYTVFEDRRGRIWAGTASGLSLYHPEADRDPPKTIISNEQNLKEIPPRGRVRFLFSGVDKWQFTPSDRLLFSYRLDNMAWSAFSPRRFITLTSPPGNHQLVVRAMDRNWNIDPNPAVFDFTVLAPWYRERGFIIIAATAISVILSLIVVSILDYTKLYKAYAHIREANRKLRELDRLKSAFVSQASHDLRTPLTTIKSSLDNLMRGVGGGLNEKQKQVIERAQRSVNRLAHLINDVLDLARIESGRIVLEKQEVSLRGVTETIVSENLTAARQKQIVLRLIETEDPFMVYVDRGKIERVVGELVSNAVKYTSDRGLVEVHLNRDKDGWVSLSVKDTGIGMTHTDCTRIFERFYRTPVSQNIAKGSGLGLSIAKELVELHGGRISVASILGKGSTFTVYLPALQG